METRVAYVKKDVEKFKNSEIFEKTPDDLKPELLKFVTDLIEDKAISEASQGGSYDYVCDHWESYDPEKDYDGEYED